MRGATAKKIRKEAIKVSETITQEIYQMIHAKAQEVTHDELAVKEGAEFNPYDASGGNFDDAFEMGTDDGEIFFARNLLARIDALSAEGSKEDE